MRCDPAAADRRPCRPARGRPETARPAYFDSGILRTPAWHGLGIVREGDGWFTLDDILTALPDTLGSPVEMLPLMAIRQSDDGYEALHVGNRFATVRQADGKVLGVVSDRYRLVQNPEALAFGEALIDKIGGGVWETAGTLMDGSWAWGLIRMPEDMLIGGLPDEAMERRLLRPMLLPPRLKRLPLTKHPRLTSPPQPRLRASSPN